MGGEHDHRARGIVAEGAAEQIHPVELGHAEIGDDEVDVVFAEKRETGFAVLRGVDLVPVARELRGEDATEVRLVVDHEDLLLLGEHHAAEGSRTGRRGRTRRGWGLTTPRQGTVWGAVETCRSGDALPDFFALGPLASVCWARTAWRIGQMRLLRYWRIGLGAATLVGVLGAGAALAQQPVPTYPECNKKPNPQDNELAKNAHKLATSYYDRADYDKAIEHWNEALGFDCSVNDLLINIANAYEKKGDKAATIATLKVYLKRTGPNPILEEKVKHIEAAMAPAPTVTATATTVPTVTTPPTVTATAVPTAPPPVPEGPRPFGYTPWIVVGGGGALAIVGAILLPRRRRQRQHAPSNACPEPRSDARLRQHGASADASQGNTGRTLEAAGGAVLGVGLAAAAGGLVWQLGFNKPGPSWPSKSPQGAKAAKAGAGNVWVSPDRRAAAGSPAWWSAARSSDAGGSRWRSAPRCGGRAGRWRRRRR